MDKSMVDSRVQRVANRAVDDGKALRQVGGTQRGLLTFVPFFAYA